MTSYRTLRILLAAALGGLVILYLAAIGPYWNISPDSVTYVQWGQSLAAGEWTRHLLPPGTSLAYSVVLRAFPSGYLALNAASTLLVLTALAVAGITIARQESAGKAAVVILLSIAWTGLQMQNTQLLSEPLYMFCSMLVLLLLSRDERAAEPTTPAIDPERPARVAAAGVLLIVACMTRTVGILLALAVIVVEVYDRIRWRHRASGPRIAIAGLALATVLAWDFTGERSYLDVVATGPFLRESAWDPGSTSLTATDILDRIRVNLDNVPAVGRALVNGWSTGHPRLDFALHVAGLLTFAIGLLASLRRRVTVAGVYVLLDVGMVAARTAVSGSTDPRHLMPVAPWLFLYAWDGARVIAMLVRQSLRDGVPEIVPRAAGYAYVAAFTVYGTTTAAALARAAHTSPFGEFPIKRPSNFDLQRLAMWMRDSAGPEDRFASAQCDMVQVLAARTGVALPLVPIPADSLVSWLVHERIRWVLLDRRVVANRDVVEGAARTRPQRFRLVSQLRRASLYEVLPADSGVTQPAGGTPARSDRPSGRP